MTPPEPGKALLARHRSTSLVAFGGGAAKSAGQLVADAATVAARLPPASPDSEIVLVFRHDRYAFAAALLGAWSAGHSVTLPANSRRDSVWKVIAGEQVASVLHDTGAGTGLSVPRLLESSAAPSGNMSSVVVPDRQVILTLHTSGSSGDARAFGKSERQLLGEACALASAFSIRDGSKFVGTVPPGHIYGVLFTVLVPLVSGSAFMRSAPLHVSSIAAAIAEFSANVLVTVPAHVRGFRTVSSGTLSSLELAFSSTAELPEADAEHFETVHAVALTEVLGSTETGGIGWRRRNEFRDWTPLPGVEVGVDDDGHLVVSSPYAETTTDGRYRTQDLATIGADGTFVHHGRADDIVKVAGHRVSLSAVEALAREVEGVEDAVAVSVVDPSGRGRQLLLAVQSSATSKAAVRSSLAGELEASVLPRQIRIAQNIPRERNGKLSRAGAMYLFGRDATGVPFDTQLTWSEASWTSERSERRCEFRIGVPGNYVYFQGHFAGYPILPAAVQLRDIVVAGVSRVRPRLGPMIAARGLKFTQRISPGQELTLSLQWRDGEPSVAFALRRDETVCSTGRVEFGLQESPP